jgi:hypothetical protein
LLNFKNLPIDTLKIPQGYDIDNITIQHDSEIAGNDSTQEEADQHLASILQTVIDELIDQRNDYELYDDDE